MAPMRLDLGCPVHCTDATFGELADVIVDPTTRRVTHLVVQPEHRPDEARAVPVEWAADAEGPDPGIALSSSVAEVEGLDRVRENAYLRLGEFPIDDPRWDIGVEDVLGLPYYQGIDAQAIAVDARIMVSYDRIPKGDVEIRRASEVTTATGEHLGHVDGFVVDADEHISHVVLERGHLWGRREVAIPIGAVERVESDMVVLSLSRDEVGALPSHRIHRWRGR
jgi:sporulation protein YlmC with PRC-barrel domain